MARLVAELDGARAEAAARRLHSEMGRLGAVAQTVDAKFSKAEVGTREYGIALKSLQGALNRGVIDQKEYNRLLDAAKAKYVNASQGAEQYGRSLTKVGQGMTSAGAAISRVTLPLLAVGGVSVKLASDFESSFAGIRKTVDATEPQFAKLAQGMRNLSKEIPVNVNELNRIGEAAGQLGIRTENILSFTETVAALGATTNLTADEVATSFAKIANITGLPQDQFDRLGSSLVDLGNNFATTEQDIVAFALRIAGAGEIAGLTEPQILGIGTALSSVGVEAEAGGTSVQKVLLSMVRAVAEGGDELETFARTAGLSAADFSRAFREDAGATFAAFVTGLGRQGDAAFQTLEELNLADQRLIRSFLSLAGAGDLVERAMATGTEAFSENTALAEEAEQRYKTFESQLTLTMNELKDVGITLGTALLPVLRDALSAVRPLVSIAAALAEKFAALPGPLKATVVALGLLVGAAGPAIYVLGSLITAAGTIATTFPGATAKIVLMGRGLSVLASGPLVLLGAAFVAAGIVINQQITQWREASERELGAMIVQIDGVKNALGELRQAASIGIITDDEVLRATAALNALDAELGKIRREMRSTTDADRFDQLGLNRDELVRQRGMLQAWINVAAKVPRVNEEITVTEGDVARAVGKTTSGLKDAISAHEKAISAAEKRIQAIESDYKDLTSAIDATAKALGGLDALDLAKWVEENLSQVPKVAEEWNDLAESIRNADEALADLGAPPARIEPPEQTADIVTFPVPGSAEFLETLQQIRDLEYERVEFTAEINAALKEGTISIQEAYKISQALGIEFEHWTTTLAEGFAEIGAIVGEFDADLGRALQRAGELVRLYQQAGANLSTTQAAGAVASNVQSANDPRYAAIGAAVGAAIGAAIGGYFAGPGGAATGAKWGAVIGSWLGSMINTGVKAFYAEIQSTVGKAFLGSSPEGGGFREIASAIGNQITKTIDDILFLVGAELQSIGGGVTISHRRGWSVIVDGVVNYFEDNADAAMSFAIAEALKRATITGASPEVIAALANTIAQDINSLFEDLKIAVEVRDLDLEDVQRAFRKIAEEAAFLTKRAEELGFGLEAIARIARSEVRNLGELRNSILGIEEDPADRIRRQAALFNAELALRRADLESQRAELQAEAEILRLRIKLADAGIDIQKGWLAAQASLLGVEADIATTMLLTAEAAAEALAAITGRIEAIDAALAGLAGLDITDLDIAGAIGRLGRGNRGQVAGDLERLGEVLDRFARERLPSAQRAVAEFDAEWAGYLALAHNNADAQARINAEMEEQRRILNQQLAENVYSGIRAFERDPDQSAFRAGIDEVAAEAERLKTDFLDLAEAMNFGAGRIARGLGRVVAAEQARIESLAGREAQDLRFALLDFLGKSEEAERLRFEITKAELQIRYEELKIAVEQYNLQIAALEAIGALVGEVAELDFDGWRALRNATPNVQRFQRSTDNAANAAQALADRLARGKEAVGEFIAGLDRGDLGGVSTLEGLGAARTQFDEIFRQARAGNIDALESFPEAARNLLTLARDAYASSPEFQAIFEMVRAAGEALLGVKRVTSDNVVFDERFFAAQHQTTAATTQGAEKTSNAVRDGADQTSRAVEAMGRVVADAVNRQGDQQTDRLGKIQESLNAALAGQQRLKGVA